MRSFFRNAALPVLFFALAAGASLAQSSAKPSKSAGDAKDAVTDLKIIITGAPKAVPIDNASVYVRYDEPRFLRHPEQIELDLKTDLKGITRVKDVPQKKIMIQVVKDGWKPFGQYYVLDKDKMTINITMQPPYHWY
ncbi:MAG TPA: hypothetical protein VGR81_01835 [Candidatus Acidoferrales bacterium]|nr:hypothetical protein [Candidatus Acidoferrales bacterium]